ncbi:MAG TPA: hypothetical protein VFP33_13055 [Gallionella sp.]|nr:hypothetical protein [Gallionella sp.]
MITRNNNPLIWKATSPIPPSMLPYFVARVAEEGGNYLTINGDAINVHEALRFKAIVDDEVLNARMFLAMTDIPSKRSEAIAGMRMAAFRAGQHYRSYVRNLNLTENPLGTPLLLSSHQDLDEQFNRGFSFNPFAERDYN